MKVYTKTGDKGQTSLFGGERRRKDDDRIEAYGTVDELNADIGVLQMYVRQEEVVLFLQEIQSRLFDIGAHLATLPGKKVALPILDDDLTDALERAIDHMQANLPELRHFILPGGHDGAAYAHVCRTTCRRAERRVVSLEFDFETIVRYLNRLSDYFFVLSRWLGHEDGATEIKWIPRKQKADRT